MSHASQTTRMAAGALSYNHIGKQTVSFVAEPLQWDFSRVESFGDVVIGRTDGDVIDGLVDCDVLSETYFFRPSRVSGCWRIRKRFVSAVSRVSCADSTEA